MKINAIAVRNTPETRKYFGKPRKGFSVALNNLSMQSPFLIWRFHDNCIEEMHCSKGTPFGPNSCLVGPNKINLTLEPDEFIKFAEQVAPLPKHVITIDGKDIELSQESYEALKKQLT